MSDDEGDDERMDRARRIRDLREGTRSRGGETEQDDESGASADDDPTSAVDADDPTSAGDDGPTSTAEDEIPSGGSASDDGNADAADSVADTASDPGPGPETTASEGADPEGFDSAEAAATDASGIASAGTDDEDALAAAQAAAAAASEFEGDGAVTVDPDEESGAIETPGEDSDGSGDPSEAVAPAGATVADASVEETEAEETRVLEFRLGEELYCLDIEYVEEIVREETVTRVPNTPEYVSGVVDLRGQITTILDPKTAIGMERTDDDQLIVVFDAETFDDHGSIGWLVDEVNQVTPIAEREVKESPIQESYINGVIERDDEFVIWTTPELALDIDEE